MDFWLRVCHTKEHSAADTDTIFFLTFSLPLFCIGNLAIVGVGAIILLASQFQYWNLFFYYFLGLKQIIASLTNLVGRYFALKVQKILQV